MGAGQRQGHQHRQSGQQDEPAGTPGPEDLRGGYRRGVTPAQHRRLVVPRQPPVRVAQPVLGPREAHDLDEDRRHLFAQVITTFAT